MVGMRTRPLFLTFILLLIVLAPAAASAQLAGEQIQYSYSLNVDQMMSCFGVTSSDRALLINTTPDVQLQNPLVIMGSNLGMIEQNSFNAYVSGHRLDSTRITRDGITSYNGNPLSSYDLVLVGGPEHNAFTKLYTDMGILTCQGTDIKMPGMVMEVAQQSNGHKIVVIGDVSGYPYHRKDLPLNGFLPETLAPAFAIALGTGLGALGAFVATSDAFEGIRRRARKFLSGFRNAHTAEAASESYSDAYEARKTLVFGFSARELVTLLACCVLFTGAFAIADRLELDITVLALYMVMGIIAVVVHDFGHRMVAQKLEIDGEYRFWGLGTVTMLLTSWLFGMAFAQPARYVFNNEDELEMRDMALVTLAGPAVSLLFAILFLPFALIGGVAGQIAIAGFTMNLMTTVYNLMPFSPMDGKIIYEWSRLFWMLTFMPLALFFILMTLFFL
jgi:Zn-dependent protease